MLGGSITDLSGLGDQPLKPKEPIDDNYIEYCDPFDTTIVDTATIPGQAELKFLEKELLSDLKTVESDEEFDPRAEEPQSRKTSSAGVNKTVAFTLPIIQAEADIFEVDEPESKKATQPLTPYYVRNNSIPEQFPEDDRDPFDTSFIADIAPGKAELKVIEKELFQANSTLSHSISDPDFDPRDDKQVAAAKVVQTIKEISNNPAKIHTKPNDIDLLSINNDVSAKVLTPAAQKSPEFDDISYTDPFDTSCASNILPGKAELKLLETELIHSGTELKRVLTDPDFNPRDSSPVKELPNKISNVPDLLEHTVENDTIKPLTPVIGNRVSFEIGDNDDIDPFDTTIANNIGPGQTELKLLESELIRNGC